MARRQHLDPVAAFIAELAEELAHSACGDLVAARVSEHGLSSGGMDPFDRLRQARPGVRDVAGLSGDEVATEDFLHLAYMSRFDQKASEVGPADQTLARDEL